MGGGGGAGRAILHVRLDGLFRIWYKDFTHEIYIIHVRALQYLAYVTWLHVVAPFTETKCAAAKGTNVCDANIEPMYNSTRNHTQNHKYFTSWVFLFTAIYTCAWKMLIYLFWHSTHIFAALRRALWRDNGWHVRDLSSPYAWQIASKWRLTKWLLCDWLHRFLWWRADWFPANVPWVNIHPHFIKSSMEPFKQICSIWIGLPCSYQIYMIHFGHIQRAMGNPIEAWHVLNNPRTHEGPRHSIS